MSNDASSPPLLAMCSAALLLPAAAGQNAPVFKILESIPVPSHLAFALANSIVPGMTTVIESHEADILRRVVDPQRAGWTPETAHAILALSLPQPDAQRVSELAEKACSDELSAVEARELEDYRHVGRLLELLQSRARLSLKTAGAA